MNYKRYLYTLSLVLILLGCSTRRNTWLSRGYQNLTARYNVLFNGVQSFEEGRDNMRESTNEDFTVVLPLFAYASESGANVPSSQMQRAISKGNKLIKKHSITVKPKKKPSRGDERYAAFYGQREFNRWVDDAWMLIGKAHVYIREWPEAIYAFEMVLRDFPDHPARFEALIWLARAYIEAGQMENARLVLNRYESEGIAPNRFYGDFMATYARFWLVDNQYEQALPYCTAAAENATSRWEKIRYAFVLGQVCEKLGLNDRAEAAFKKVVSLNPDYEMSLHARIKVVLLEGGQENPALARESLTKYLKQSKNREYRDQIYFAMADTWFWEQDTLKALTQLKLAAGYGDGNPTLKGKIYLKMADVYFNSREYMAAYAYYDSSLVMLPEEELRLDEIRLLTQKLAPLSAHLQVIEREDSLQRIAAMGASERDAFLESLLLKNQQKKEQSTFSNTSDDAFFFRNLANKGNQSTDEQGNWYFYNQTMVSLGKMEFEKRWGRRPLADDWRRMNKKAQSIERGDRELGMMPPDPFSAEDGPGAPPVVAAEEGGPQGDEPPDKAALLDAIPLTPEKMDASRQRVEEALFGAGMVFSEQLDKYQEASELFDQLLLDFPKTRHRQEALMMLYLSCEHLNDNACMDERKQQYLSEFSGTRFADYLEDPEFMEKQKAYDEKMNRCYREAYMAYRSGAWGEAVERAQEVVQGQLESLKGQATLLMAMAYGRSGDVIRFEEELNTVVKNHPATPEGNLAREWLKMLQDGRRPVVLASSDKASVTSPVVAVEGREVGDLADRNGFVLEPDSAHYMWMVVSDEANINQLMFNVADYNFERFLIGDYQLKSSRLTNGQRVLQVGPFPNKSIGMDYFFSVRDNNSLLKGSHAGGSLFLLVSENNLKRLLKSADIVSYQSFFLEHYLQGSEATAVVVSQREVLAGEDAEDSELSETDVERDAEAFVVDQGSVMGMVVLPSDSGNKKRAMQFLPNYVRNITAVSVKVSEELLSDGTTVLLIKTFDDLELFNKLNKALMVNPYWTGQLAGSDWAIYPVSMQNFKVIMEQGSLQSYLEFRKTIEDK